MNNELAQLKNFMKGKVTMHLTYKGIYVYFMRKEFYEYSSPSKSNHDNDNTNDES